MADGVTSATSIATKGGVFVAQACFRRPSSRRDFRNSLQFAERLSYTALHGAMLGSGPATPFEHYFKQTNAKEVITVLRRSLDTLGHVDMNIRITCIDCSAKSNHTSVSAHILADGRQQIRLCTGGPFGASEASRESSSNSCEVASGQSIFASLLYFASGGAITRTLGRNITVARMTPEEVSKLNEQKLCELIGKNHVTDERGHQIEPTSAYECYVSLFVGRVPRKIAGTCGVENLTYIQEFETTTKTSNKLQNMWRVLGNSFVRAGLETQTSSDQYEMDAIEGEKFAISISGP
ncbi:MAG: hypothetical protein M1814_002620 [Vezdaea aestivalis]|nr:MAG: hypothetical protein M1814_002620 [Vezdaea aestivalis]